MPTLDSLTPYLTLLLFLAPLLPRLINLLTSLFRPSPAHPRTPTQPLPYTVLVLLGLHTIYHLRPFFFPPSDDPNIFTRTGTPLFAASTGELRARLMGRVRGGVLSDPTQAVLQRLQSYESRVLYARFGQKTLVECTWCAPASSEGAGWDYLVYWAVGAAAGWIGEGVWWGLVTGLSGRLNWRGTGVWVLLGWGCLEGGWRWFGGVELGGMERRGEGRMIHSLLTTYILPPIFALLPLTLPLLPPPPIPTPSALTTLPSLLPTAETLLTHLKLIELSRIASLRDPTLRASIVATATQSEKDARVARESKEVQEAGERVGLTAEEGVRGGLREGARGFLGVAKQRMEATLVGMGLASRQEA